LHTLGKCFAGRCNQGFCELIQAEHAEAMVAAKNNMLAWKNDKYQMVCPGVTANGSINPKAFTALQITAMTKQVIPSQ
jgi:hypothetical protein